MHWCAWNARIGAGAPRTGAGRAGRFGLVLDLDRGAGHEALMHSGADLVVNESDDLLPLSVG